MRSLDFLYYNILLCGLSRENKILFWTFPNSTLFGNPSCFFVPLVV